MRWMVTGAAGFIGFHLSRELLRLGHDVVGIDIVNDYYDPQLKEDRIKVLEKESAERGQKFTLHREDLSETAITTELIVAEAPDYVVHLAAQAGVRYSLENPHAYITSNVAAFMNVLEGCRNAETGHLVYASTSSVYGANLDLPFSESQVVGHPLQLYAATKRANELMAHSYSHLYGLPTSGLRFFTVYGPWGRPDMALFLFTKNILAGEPIRVFNNGDHARDFTYVSDIVEGIIKVGLKPATGSKDWDAKKPDPASSSAPFRVLNIGNGRAVPLMKYVRCLEEVLGKEAVIDYLPLQPGDVPETHADTTRLQDLVSYCPSTPVEEGIRQFVDWYRSYYAE